MKTPSSSISVMQVFTVVDCFLVVNDAIVVPRNRCYPPGDVTASGRHLTRALLASRGMRVEVVGF